jgi:sn-glycerol 3-phosphate transport system ATP-binding protein
VLREGSLVQFDTPREIYHCPANRFVAEFIGRPAMNVFDGEMRAGVLHTDGFRLPLPGRTDGPLALGIRSEQIQVVDDSAQDALHFAVDVVELVEPDALVFARAKTSAVIVRISNDQVSIEPGQPLRLRFPAAALHFFDKVTGVRLS